jgi:polysaccharide deacetylase family protein (PEP-CTERM system associated)
VIELFGNDEPPPNVLTVDVEDWYHLNYKSLNRSSMDTSVDRVYANTMNILEILDRVGSKATFFVLGCIARKHPALVRAIDSGGHELACHGDEHELVYDQSQNEFRNDLRKAVDSIAEHASTRVAGFRAPSWSITEKNPWALDIIAEEGFLYDSSIFPVKNYMYGIRHFPMQACWLTTKGGGRLLEVPATAAEFMNAKIPCGGGIYLRLLPLRIHKRLIKTVRRHKRPFMLYFHPSDIDQEHIKIDLSFKERFFQKAGRRTARNKILTLLEDYRWVGVNEAFAPVLSKHTEYNPK